MTNSNRYDEAEEQPLLLAGKKDVKGIVVGTADDILLTEADDNIDNIEEGGYFLFCVPISWVSSKNTNMKNSATATVILLLNSMIGSGILVQAYVFREAGIVVTIVEYAFVGTMTYVGVDLLIRCADQTQIFEYSELCTAAFGPYGEVLLDICVVTGNLGALLSYIVIIGSLMENILMVYGVASAWYTTATFWSFVLVTLFVVPTCCIRNYGHLAFISYISITAISGTILLVLFGGPANASAHSYEPLNFASMKGSLETIGSVVFAFGYASAVFHSYTAMKRSERNVETFSKVAVYTTSLGVSMCFLIGLVGYLCFRNDVDADILENFAGGAGTFFKVIVILHLIFYIPGDFLIMRYSFFKLLGGNSTTADDFSYFTGTFSLLAFATALACLIQLYGSTSQSLSMILDLTGGISGSMVSFVLPGLMAMRLLSTDTETYFRGLILVIFGSIIPVLVLMSNIVNHMS